MKKTLTTTEIKSLDNTGLAAAAGAATTVAPVRGVPAEIFTRLGYSANQFQGWLTRGIPVDIYRQLQQYGY